MVFQYPEHQLFAETVFEDIAFGPRNKGFAEDEVEKQVREAMAFVGLDYDTYAQRSPFQLSGGQMRRVAIAGVVAMNPDYLVLTSLPQAWTHAAVMQYSRKSCRCTRAVVLLLCW